MQLDLAQLAEALRDCAVGHTIDYHPSLPSTMPVAHQLAALPETRSGTLVVAEEQTAGRGRHQRNWQAPISQALLCSVILKAPLALELSQVPQAIGVAVAQAIESCVPELTGRVGLKWPNDVLLGSTMQDAGKTAGILIESTWQADALSHVIVGIGLNVNQSADGLPSPMPSAPSPTSLRLFLQRTDPLDRTAVLIALCRALGEWYTNPTQSALIHPTWRQRLWTLHQQVSVYEQGELLVQGEAIEVGADGSLVVVDQAGRQQRFAAGDVTVRAS